MNAQNKIAESDSAFLYDAGTAGAVLKITPKADSGRSLLRIVTAGSVDDGKSTLIGRLLFDANAIKSDQLSAISSGQAEVNLARLTDGLRAEREQGITIDVAHRYWESDQRKFIIADAPGHSQYTRNMVTAASNADVAVVVVDARNGVLEQTRRHLYIAALLGLHSIIVCVNKMDLVDFSRAVFDDLVSEISALNRALPSQLFYVPVSALHGDNIVEKSDRTPWYSGGSLLELLNQLPGAESREKLPARMPVQLVIRHEPTEFRGYAGQIASGSFAVGDEVIALPAGHRTRIKAIDTYDGELERATSPLSVVLRVEDELDIGRGDLIVKADSQPITTACFRAELCWFDTVDSSAQRTFWLKHGTTVAKARIERIESQLNLHTFEHESPSRNTLVTNDIANVTIRTGKEIALDPFDQNRFTGSFILIDASTHATAAAGLLLGLPQD